MEFIAIPGFGFFGITGIGVLFYGLYLLLIPDIPVSDEIYSQALDGFSWGIVGGIIALIMVINLLLKSKFLERFITTDSNVSNLKKNYKKRGKV